MSAVALPGGRTPEERQYYSLNERVYRKLAPFYDLAVFPLRRLRRDVVRISGATSASKVLDVATGTGEQACAFAASCHEVVGIDISEPMLGRARRKNRFDNLRFLRADAIDLPFGDGEFDVSCICLALHEMPPSIREAVLREMGRVTMPSGRIVIVDYRLPDNPVGRFVGYHAVKLYERDHYAEFVTSDLSVLLATVAIHVREERPALLGMVRIVAGSRCAVQRRDGVA